EAREKSRAGMRIFVREGSSAKNLKALIGLEDAFALCTDDKHADDLLRTGHMDHLLSMAVGEGKDPIDALRMATLNPARHYSLDGGSFEESRRANILVLDGLEDFLPRSVYFHGKEICRNGSLLARPKTLTRNMRVMNAKKIGPGHLNVVEKYRDHIIGAIDGELTTMHLHQGASMLADAQKLAVIDRYEGKCLSCAYVKGFGLRGCAIAQTIAHDSHNIIATGSDDWLIVEAVNGLIDLGGGIVARSPSESIEIALDVSGLMSTMAPEDLGRKLGALDRFLSEHGAMMQNTVTTLSFMALLVIPHLKLSDKGLFDVDSFKFIDKC
ncbi:MAG: adenine deaminase, partial [Candidatus Methanofastidiosa archaeon]|nr:adenine deaminase [Candidatus Methanofastidiosa archaeon]